uniref:Myosin tail domain-containing protein n=1 Tax=Arcella intermedia TaxID=1963864 RepID=A0A6B2L810_9EUKA
MDSKEHQIEDDLNSLDAEIHNRIENDHFEYDINLNDEHSHANAAQLALLVKRNKKLLDQMEELEDRLFDSEELKSTLQRKLNLVQKEVEDFRVLYQQRDAEHQKLAKELEAIQAKIATRSSERQEADDVRRELEHKIAILKTEAQENERAQAKADKAADEAESLRRRIGDVIDQKASRANELTELDKRKGDLEKKLEDAVVHNREYNSKTVADLEKVIDAERKRGQQAIDHVKRTLNARLRFLELQLEEGRENVTNFTKEKRSLEKQLKSAIKELEEEETLSNHLALRAEALSRQLTQLNATSSKAFKELGQQELTNYELSRQKDTLTAQLDAASYINAKLSDELPVAARAKLEEAKAQDKQKE